MNVKGTRGTTWEVKGVGSLGLQVAVCRGAFRGEAPHSWLGIWDVDHPALP